MKHTIHKADYMLYRELKTDGTQEVSSWNGMIKANPAGRPLRIGALTCQNHYGFPYEPVAENIVVRVNLHDILR